jgi:hypothetical protein
MKRTILIAFAAIGLNAAIAQTNTPVGRDLNGVDPPAVVTNKFQTDYPNINADWRMDEDNYAAEYRDPATNMGRILVYDRNANLIRTDNEMKEGYPDMIGNYYTKTYPNEDYKVWSSKDGKGNITYYSNRNDDVLWFDKNGKYTKTKPGNRVKKSKNATRNKSEDMNDDVTKKSENTTNKKNSPR